MTKFDDLNAALADLTTKSAANALADQTAAASAQAVVAAQAQADSDAASDTQATSDLADSANALEALLVAEFGVPAGATASAITAAGS